MRVSVVICTYNRGSSLRETLLSLQSQRYENFEVVVVNGPSTDDTEAVLVEFGGLIRTARCPAPNLSMSRNIGIRAAAGDVVAFIDDDALPEFDWLNQALPAFTDPGIGGVGGIVFDHTGMELQYRFSSADRFGQALHRSTEPFDDLSVPGSSQFPYLQGTNALFRRSALEEVGGFDETYEYYLDETDVCCRLVDAGFVLRQLRNAPVHHKFLPSGIRSADRVVTNWYPMIKNLTYFGFRHALESSSEREILERSEAFAAMCVRDAVSHERGGRLPRGSAKNVRRIGEEALARGEELGRERATLRLPRLPPAEASQFRPYPVVDRTNARRIVLVSGDYPPNITGGIARFIGDVAPRLVAAGHEVRVITRSGAHGTVDLEDGVWVHRIAVPLLRPGDGVAPETLPHINAFATASLAEIRRISGWSPIDVVYGPAWDVETIGALRGTPLPVVTMLATPLSVAAVHAKMLETDTQRAALEGVLAAERELFANSELLHCISAAIRTTIEQEYELTLDVERSPVVPIGLVDRAVEGVHPKPAGQRLTVLFVGRLEARKGIDDLIAAIERLGPRLPQIDWVIVGRDATSPGVESRFRSRHRNDEWATTVRFIGDVSDADLAGWYRQADLVVLPSRYESFGLVMVEAMMHCRPQIACAVGGVTEVVSGSEGVLVAPESAGELADAIERLVEYGAEREAMSRSGRRRFETDFEIGVASKRLLEVLQRVKLWPAPSDRCRPVGAGVASETRDGFSVASIQPGQGVDVLAPFGERSLLCVHCADPCEAELRSSSEVHSVMLPIGWSRLRLDPSDDFIRLNSVRGVVAVAGVISVGGVSGC